MHVLIADDDLTSLNALSTLLRSWDYQVTAVGDGGRAWQALLRPDPPLICLLDRQMPLDGINLCRRIRTTEATAKTYVLFITVRGSKQDLVDGFAAGADDYVTKPFDRDELRARLSLGKRVVELQSALSNRPRGKGP